jgi:hypothetical protein
MVFGKLTLLMSVLDISQWLTFVTILLLVTAELISHFGPARGVLIDKSRLQAVAITTGLMVLAIVAFQVFSEWTS